MADERALIILAAVTIVTFALQVSFTLRHRSCCASTQQENTTHKKSQSSQLRLPLGSATPNKYAANDSADVATRRPHHVLVVAYYRGGSSFLGELLNHSPDLFYWFEPLRRARNSVASSLRGELSQPDVLRLDELFEPARLARSSTDTREALEDHLASNLRTIRGTLTCNMTEVGLAVLEDSNVWSGRKSRLTHAFAGCIHSLGGHRLSECVRHLVGACMQSPGVAVKTIRLWIYMIRELLETDPDLRIVYETRDPRGIMNSRLLLNGASKLTQPIIERSADALCRKMYIDLTDYYLLRQQYPTRVHLVQYENLALQPRNETERLYRYLGYDRVPEEVYSWIQENTNQNTPLRLKGYSYVTKRKSSLHAHAWKRILPMKTQQYMTRKCAGVIKLLESI